MRSFLILWAAISMGILQAGHAFAVEPGDEAPRFELSSLDGGYGESSSLFGSHGLTFLLFWESQCRHCVESLARAGQFDRDYGGGDIAVLGVNTDSDGLLNVRSIVESAGADFPQLLDQGGTVADLYGVPFATLALFLVDSRGIVVARSIDPEGDMYALMEEMLSAPLPEAVARPQEPSAAGGGMGLGLTFRGDERIRFLGIDTRGGDPVGPYGEEVASGNHVQYRFTLEMTKRLGRHLTRGARCSNRVPTISGRSGGAPSPRSNTVNSGRVSATTRFT